jgi:hypothetical protein
LIPGALLRVAHSFGNSRHLVEAAQKSPIDMIEGDVRLRDGRLWLGHDYRLPLLPICVSRRSLEPPARGLVRFGPWQARLDLNPLPLEGLLEMAGRCRLLLDLKQSRRSEDASEFVETLAELLRRFDRATSDCLCGDWPFLDAARYLLPETRLYYSVGDRRGWQALVQRLNGGDPITGVSLRSSLFDGSSAHILQSKGVETLCWCVDDPAEAVRVTMLGAGGIISNDLALLAGIGGTTASG